MEFRKRYVCVPTLFDYLFRHITVLKNVLKYWPYIITYPGPFLFCNYFIVLKSKGIILVALFSPISLITTKFMGAKASRGEGGKKTAGRP